MKKYQRAILTILTLGMIATLLPIFGGYLVSFLLLIWLAAQRWEGAGIRNREDAFSEFCSRIFTPMLAGTTLLFVSFLLANLVANGLSEDPIAWSKVGSRMSHFWVKYWLLPFVVVGAWVAAVRGKISPDKMSLWILIWFGVHTVYVLAQRKWGIDWSRGFDAELGPHRFAYGVYRVSGFMGHPLTLAYCLCLWMVFGGAMARVAKTSGLQSSARHWLIVTVLVSLTLLVSGGRFPLAVMAIVGLLLYAGQLLRHVKILTVLGIAVLGLLYFEGSVLGRILEVFDANRELGQRFPRVYFWQAHWNMFLDHPIAGVGINGLKQALPTYYHELGYHDKMYSAHNIYLQFLADSGLIGFAGLIGFLVGLGISARRFFLTTGSKALWGVFLVTVVAGCMQNVLRDSEYIYGLWVMSTILVVQYADRMTAQDQDATETAGKPPQDLQPNPGG